MSLPPFNPGDPTTAEGWADEVGPGWRQLVLPLATFCIAHGGRVDQVKEKFGTLRLYYTRPKPSDEMTPEEELLWEVFDMAVEGAEHASAMLCELYGTWDGKLCTEDLNGGTAWWKTYGPKAAAEQGYVYPTYKPGNSLV